MLTNSCSTISTLAFPLSYSKCVQMPSTILLRKLLQTFYYRSVPFLEYSVNNNKLIVSVQWSTVDVSGANLVSLRSVWSEHKTKLFLALAFSY